jgi:23S rRNA (adenine1618-N6)-methyltransferase
MVCPGGELAFVRRMAEESAALRGAVHWYTSMVGKKATLKEMRKELHALGVTALRTTELAQARAGGRVWD